MRARGRSRQLVGALDAELAGDALERLPLQRLVAALVRVAQDGERALERRPRFDGRARVRGRTTRYQRREPRAREEQAAAERRARARRASVGEMRYVGAASGVKSKRQFRWFVLRRNAATPGLTCESDLDRRKARVDAVRAACRQREVVDASRMETEDVELVARRRRGTHGDVMQRSVHVHVTCAKRPTPTRRTVGLRVEPYGAKSVVTRRRAGSTHFVSATIAILAVSSSPKRCTVGVIVA